MQRRVAPYACISFSVERKSLRVPTSSVTLNSHSTEIKNGKEPSNTSRMVDMSPSRYGFLVSFPCIVASTHLHRCFILG